MERFDLKTTEDLEQIRENRNPPVCADNTVRNTNWAITTWNKWAEWRNLVSEEGELTHIPSNEGLVELPDEALAKFLSLYVCEVKKEDGSYYSPDTLYNLLCGLNRYLRMQEGKSDINIFEEKGAFAEFRRTLDGQIINLNKSEGGFVRRTPDVITEEQECVLWDKAIFSMHTAQGLSYATFHYISKSFGLRGRDRHRELKVESFSLGSDTRGRYIELLSSQPDGSVKGRKVIRVSKRQSKCYDESSNGMCAYKVITTYLSYMPGTGIFYKKPQPSTPVNPVKFSDHPIGKNTLGEYTKTFMSQAGFEGHFTSSLTSNLDGAFKDGAGLSPGTEMFGNVQDYSMSYSNADLHIKTEIDMDDDSMSEHQNMCENMSKTSETTLESASLNLNIGAGFSLSSLEDRIQTSSPNTRHLPSNTNTDNPTKLKVIHIMPNTPNNNNTQASSQSLLKRNIDDINSRKRKHDDGQSLYKTAVESVVGNIFSHNSTHNGIINNLQSLPNHMVNNVESVHLKTDEHEKEMQIKQLEGVTLDNNLKHLEMTKRSLEIEQFKRIECLEKEAIELKRLKKIKMSLEIDKLRLEKEKLELEVNSVRCAQSSNL